jgi:hypothetical protein
MAKIVTYDLRSPGKDYSSLIAAIKRYTNCKITESCWLLSTIDSCEAIRNYLQQYMDSNDRLFVGALTGEAAWSNLLSSNDTVKKVF